MTETAAGAGVLSGIKVVDFGHFVAGPLTAVMLADQGAEVVHVDRPGAELAEADAFLNRGKRRVTLDLKDPADAAIAARLAASANVVIENFRPGVMDRHGLGWQQLAPVAPQLIYCSLPGFGRDDPRAAIPAWEGVVAAATANCSIRVGQEPEGWDTTQAHLQRGPAGLELRRLPGRHRDRGGAHVPASHGPGSADRSAALPCDVRADRQGGLLRAGRRTGSAETAQRQRERHVRVRRWPVHPDGPDRRQRPVPPLATGRRGCGVLGGGRPDRRGAPGPA